MDDLRKAFEAWANKFPALQTPRQAYQAGRAAGRADLEAQLGEAQKLLNSCKIAMAHVSYNGGYADWKHMISAIDKQLSHLTIASPEPTTPAEPAPTVVDSPSERIK